MLSAAIIKAADVQVGFSLGQKKFSSNCHPMNGIFFLSEIFNTSINIFFALETLPDIVKAIINSHVSATVIQGSSLTHFTPNPSI